MKAKKVFSVILTLAMVLSLLPSIAIPAFAAGTYTVSGTVITGSTGALAEGIPVTLFSAADGTTVCGSATTVAGGTYSTSNVPDGDYIAVIAAAGDGSYARAAKYVTVSGDDATADITLSAPTNTWQDYCSLTPPDFDDTTQTYTVDTAAELAWVAYMANTEQNNFSGYTVQLSGDLSLAGHDWMPIGIDGSKYFGGTFDGGGHHITELTVDSSTFYRYGLFGIIRNAAIENVGVSGTVNARRDVQTQAGLLVGISDQSSIISCYSSGTVTSTGKYGAPLGGLVGSFRNSSQDSTVYNMESCYTNAVVTGAAGSAAFAGGLIGEVQGAKAETLIVKNSYAAGTVSSPNYSGGLIGVIRDLGGISDVYSSGPVTGTTGHGGLIGFDNSAGYTISNAYWDETVNAGMTGVGFGTDTSTSSTTAQMATAAFAEILNGSQASVPWRWNKNVNNAYPVLHNVGDGDYAAYTISGTVSPGTSGAAVEGLTVTLYASDDTTYATAMYTGTTTDGSYSISGVPNGTYTAVIAASAESFAQSVLAAIEVNGADVTGADITLVEVPDYIITYSGGYYLVNDIGTYSTFNAALTGGCIASNPVIQLGRSETPLSLGDLSTADALNNSLISATYTGSVSIQGNGSLADESLSCGLCVPTGVTAVFDGLTMITNGTSVADLSAIYVNGGSLTVESGSLTAAGDEEAVIKNDGGSVTINGGTIQNTYTGSATDGCYALNNTGNGNATIHGGTLEVSGNDAKVIYQSSTGTLTMTGGTVKASSTDSSGNNVGIGVVANTGKVTVSGGSVLSDGRGDSSAAIMLLSAAGSEVEITGTSQVTGAMHAIQNTIHSAIGTSTGTVNITGGTVTSTAGSSITISNEGTVNISGGTVKTLGSNPAVYCLSVSASSPASLDISGSAVISSADAYSIYLYSPSHVGSAVADTESASIFEKKVYSDDKADIVISGAAVIGGYEINSLNYASATVNAVVYSGHGFVGWASDQARTSVVSAANPDTIANLTTGDNSLVTSIYLKTEAVVTPDYIVTGGPTSFSVSGDDITYTTLADALGACADDGDDDVLTIQLGESASETLNITDVSSASFAKNTLIPATYSGWVFIGDDSSVDCGIGLAVTGSNTVTLDGLVITTAEFAQTYFYAMYLPSSGASHLNIQGDTAITASGVGYSVYNASPTGTICMTSGTVAANGSDATGIQSNGTAEISGGTVSGNYGIRAENSLTISGNALVTGGCTGIYLYGTSSSLDINGGIIEATDAGGKAVLALTTGGTVTMTGGTVRATDTTNTSQSIGLMNRSSTAANISGGTISCAGTNASSAGIYQNSTAAVTITGGNIEAVNYGVYSFSTKTDGDGAVYLNGGSVSAAGSIHSCAVYNQQTGLVKIASGTITSSGYSVCNSSTGTVQISGGTLHSTGTHCIVNSNGGTVEITGGTISSDSASAAAIAVSVQDAQRFSSVSILGSETRIQSACPHTITINKPSASQRALSVSLYEKTIHGIALGRIDINGSASGNNYKIDSSNFAAAALSASDIAVGRSFAGWASNPSITNTISEINGCTVSHLTTGDNAGVTHIYLKTGTATAVILATGSLGTAGDGSITDLTAGEKYKMTMGSIVYYVKADGTLSTSASDAAALTGTEITGLVNGSTYKVEVYKTSGGGSYTGGSSTNNASLIVNGKTQTAGTVETTTEGEKTTTTVTISTDKLKNILDSSGNGATVTIPITTGSSTASGKLDGQAVKEMEKKDATLVIQTGSASYTLPASDINIDSVSDKFGRSVSLSDIAVNISISSPSAATAKVVADAATSGGFAIKVPAVEFTVSCTYGGRTVEVSTFNSYVERMIAIPEGVDPSKITTGIVVEPDGCIHHVPTEIAVIDGKYYAKINSLTNSVYSVIYNPVEFSDVENHWAKDSINNMGSRLVVNGVGNNCYEPNRSITRAEFSAIIVKALGLEPDTSKNSFSDVVLTDWFCGYIATAASYGIVNGYGDGYFGPNDLITREQAMTMIARAMKITGLEASLTDSEVSSLLSAYSDAAAAKTYAKESIAACLKIGIVNGTSKTTISPKSYVTRAEVAVMAERLLQKSELI